MTTNVNGVLETYFHKYADDPDFIAEGMAIAILEDALRIMRDRGLTRSELANRMGVSRANISRLFNAPPNLTLRTIAQLAVALKVRPSVCLDSETHPSQRD